MNKLKLSVHLTRDLYYTVTGDCSVFVYHVIFVQLTGPERQVMERGYFQGSSGEADVENRHASVGEGGEGRRAERVT